MACVWHLGGGWGLAALAGAFPGLDTRLGSKGAVPEPKGLVARFHDMAVKGEPVRERRRHLGVPKHGRPFREAQVGGDHHTGVLVQLGQKVKQQGAASLAEGQIPVSFIMALMAYLTAWCSMHVMVERKWRQWPSMLFWTWFTVDGCYWLYWHFKNPVAFELMREANAPASLSLYWMCGLVWYYRGTLRER